jgi:uncharacterized protein Yka (UPF0111/DUF47 family)
MYKLCLISDVEYEAFKYMSEFTRALARELPYPRTRENMYEAANKYDVIVDKLWDSGTEFSPELINAVMQWKERNTNAA